MGDFYEPIVEVAIVIEVEQLNLIFLLNRTINTILRLI